MAGFSVKLFERFFVQKYLPPFKKIERLVYQVTRRPLLELALSVCFLVLTAAHAYEKVATMIVIISEMLE